MTTKNIDQLSAAGSIAGADKTMVAQGSTQLKRTTLTAVRDFIAGTLAAVATSGSAADISGLADVATSGDKADVGLGNVPNTDATNASNMSSGTLPDARLSSNVARRDQNNTFGDNTLSRFSAVASEQTDDHTIAASDNGTVILVNKSSAVTITLPNSLPPGFNCSVVQEGAGQVTFATAEGATKQSPNGYAKTSVRYGTVALLVKSNSGGSAADWRLMGDLAE